MSDDVIENLKAAGCTEVWMGVESGSQAVLDSMDEGLKLYAVRSARRLLTKASIRACYFLQFGYPGESWTELQETIALVRETRPDDIGISFSYPLPGTAFYGDVQGSGAKAKLDRQRRPLHYVHRGIHNGFLSSGARRPSCGGRRLARSMLRVKQAPRSPQCGREW